MMANDPILNLHETTSLGLNDYLMISQEKSSSIYSSYKVKAENLLSAFTLEFEGLVSASINGNWTFNSGKGILVDDRNIKDNESVINCRYALSVFNEKLNQLSNDIYGKKAIIPSYIGEIIYTTKLKTVDKVREKYGAFTDWEQIKGRFIMNTTNQLSVGQTVGEATVKLKLENIPDHIHNVKMNNTEKTWSVFQTVQVPEATVLIPSGSGMEPEFQNVRKIDGYALPEEGTSIADGHLLGIRDETEGASIKDCSATITATNNGTTGHNNIPPFYSVYIWRRVK